MQTEKCAKIHESSHFRSNPYQPFSHFKHNTDGRTPTCDDCQVSLCLYYMLIAVSCLHCPDATVSMNFQLTICVQHMHTIIYLLSLISPLLFAVEIPLPFINCLGQF